MLLDIYSYDFFRAGHCLDRYIKARAAIKVKNEGIIVKGPNPCPLKPKSKATIGLEATVWANNADTMTISPNVNFDFTSQ